MNQQLKKQKQEISEELSRILDKAPQLKKEQDQAVLDFNYEQAVKKLTQLYYLNYYHIDNTTSIEPKAKQGIQDNIIKEFHSNLARLMFLFEQE